MVFVDEAAEDWFAVYPVRGERDDVVGRGAEVQGAVWSGGV